LYLCAGHSGYLKKKFTNSPQLKVNFIAELVRRISPFNDLVAFIKLYFFIRKNRFDIVHTHSPKASILGRWAAYFAGVRNIVYTVHGWPFYSFLNPLLRYLYVFLEKISALITKKIIVVSSSGLREGTNKKVSSADKFVIIHYGLDTEWAERIFVKRKSGPPFKNLVINISCLKPQKGLIFFLDAIKMILKERMDMRFSILGDGPLNESINREIVKRKLTGHLSLGGWVDDISTLLSRASILVITSLWEGLPLAVIEAVASGVPVVATDTGGVLDILENGNNGIIVKRKDIEGIAAAILEIMGDYSGWHKKVVVAREKLDLMYWSDQRMAGLTEKVYQDVLAL
jgi:glycosyltransferase involved in cell wall biosynthesis